MPPVAVETPCREWPHTKHARGYGITYEEGRQYLAHRWVWEQLHGRIPPGMLVRHLCLDNPACVEPTHLALGTAKERTAAIAAAGRLDADPKRLRQPTYDERPRGERQGSSKLKAADIPTIRCRAAAGEGMREIAADYGVSHVAIANAVRGVTWRHIPDLLPVT